MIGEKNNNFSRDQSYYHKMMMMMPVFHYFN